MKKLMTLTAIAFICSTAASAQRDGRTRFSIGPEIGYAVYNPMKDITGNKGWGFGIGGSAEVEHFFKENLSGTFNVGILSYKGRAANGNTNNKAYTAIPIRVGGNAYAGSRLHFGAQIGVGINSISGASATTFAYSPQLGYNFSRNDKPLDLSLKYDGYAGSGNFAALGLRLSLIL